MQTFQLHNFIEDSSFYYKVLGKIESKRLKSVRWFKSIKDAPNKRKVSGRISLPVFNEYEKLWEDMKDRCLKKPNAYFYKEEYLEFIIKQGMRNIKELITKNKV